MKRIAMGLVACAACGSSSPASPDAMADGMPAPDGRIDMISGTVGDTTQAPIAGAKVCILDHPEIACASTGADGAWQMQLPDLQGVQIAFEATATDYLGQVVLEAEPVDDNGFHVVGWPGAFYLQTNAQAMGELGTKAGFTYPGAGTGFLQLQVDGATAGSLGGATVSISPASGAGPVYYDANGPNPALTGTTTAAHGGVAFGDLAPGRYQLTVTATGKTCSVHPNGSQVANTWPPSGSNTTDVQIAADAETRSVFVTCL